MCFAKACGGVWKKQEAGRRQQVQQHRLGRKKRTTKRTEKVEISKQNKKLKLDKEITGGRVPRFEGIQKRKRTETRTPGSLEVEKFNQQCKKLRPSFDPAEEYELELIRKTKSSLEVVSKENHSIIPSPNLMQNLFPIFNKIARSNPKQIKVKSIPKRKPSKEKALNGSGVSGKCDIRGYFNAQKTDQGAAQGPEGRIKGISSQSSQITAIKLEDRGGESEPEFRDSDLKGGGKCSLLSTSALHVLESSDQDLSLKD